MYIFFIANKSINIITDYEGFGIVFIGTSGNEMNRNPSCNF